MGVGVKGDFKALEELARQVAKMASPEVRRAVLSNMAEESLTQIRLGFQRSGDPYGVAWTPLKHPSARRGAASARPLEDSGRLKNSFKQHVTQTGFIVDSDAAYASIHQYGGTIKHKAGVVVQHLNGRFAKRSSRSHRLVTSARKAYQQGIPARPMVPDSNNLGTIWERALSKAGSDTLESLVGLK